MEKKVKILCAGNGAVVPLYSRNHTLSCANYFFRYLIRFFCRIHKRQIVRSKIIDDEKNLSNEHLERIKAGIYSNWSRLSFWNLLLFVWVVQPNVSQIVPKLNFNAKIIWKLSCMLSFVGTWKIDQMGSKQGILYSFIFWYLYFDRKPSTL